MTVPEYTTAPRWTEPLCTENRGKNHLCGFTDIMKNEMKYLNGIMHGAKADDEFRPLLTGEAARAAIATADACTMSRYENRKVQLREVLGEKSEE